MNINNMRVKLYIYGAWKRVTSEFHEKWLCVKKKMALMYQIQICCIWYSTYVLPAKIYERNL